MKAKLTFSLILGSLELIFTQNALGQNVGINSSGSAPATSAGLDVNFTDKGVLIPNVALTGTADVTTIASPATSLIVYNTATAGTIPNDVVPGYYFYNGSKWTPVGNTSSGLLLPRVTLTGSGDVTTVPIRTNSLLVYNTATASDVTPGFYYWDSTLWRKLSTGGVAAASQWTTSGLNIYNNNTGKVGIGSSNFTVPGSPDFLPQEKVLIDATISGYETGLNIVGNVDSYFQAQIQNKSDGNNASSDFVVASDDPDQYLDMGINSTSYIENKSNILNQINTPYIYASAPQWFYIGHGVSGKGLVFFTNSGNTNSNNSADGFPRMQITSAGNVGIGNFVGSGADVNNYLVSEKLMVDGNITPKTNNGGDLGTSLLKWSNLYVNTLNPTTINATTVNATTGNYTGNISAAAATFSGNVFPQANNTYDLGSSAVRWRQIWCTNSLNSTSDRRLKTNITNLKYGLKEVLALQPVTYNWKANPDGDKIIGLIAQDVRPIVPEVVHGDEMKETLSMSHTDLIPILINAVKEQQTQIDKLSKQIEELKKIVESTITVRQSF